MEDSKTCSVCGEVKHFSDYYFTNKQKTQYTAKCKECTKLVNKENKAKAPPRSETCLVCGTVNPPNSNLFCSKSCASVHSKGSPRIEVTCYWCSKVIKRKRSHALREVERVFCSRKCQWDFYEKEGRVDTKCAWCGVSYSIPAHRVSVNRFCSKSCDSAWRSTLKGDLSPGWRGGLTSEEQKLRTTKEVKEWKLAVIRRDNFTCWDCGKRGGKLFAHHIKRWKYYPDERLDLDNGATLCKECHDKYTFVERKEDARIRREEKYKEAA